jgi:hypothetical protein
MAMATSITTATAKVMKPVTAMAVATAKAMATATAMVTPTATVTAMTTITVIYRNCDVLPLLKFCTNKPILALLLRQFFLGGGKGGFHPKKGCNAPSSGYGFLRKKILHKLYTYCKLL